MACSRDQMNAAFADYVTNEVQLHCAGAQEGGKRGQPLKSMSKKDVYNIAKEMEIKGRSTMKKEELIEAVRAKAASERRRKARAEKKSGRS